MGVFPRLCFGKVGWTAITGAGVIQSTICRLVLWRSLDFCAVLCLGRFFTFTLEKNLQKFNTLCKCPPMTTQVDKKPHHDRTRIAHLNVGLHLHKIRLTQRDAKLINELGLRLKYALNTHIHADHITGTAALRNPHLLVSGFESVIAKDGGAKADLHVTHGGIIKFGKEQLEVRATPGHTNSCLTYVNHRNRMAFTGDALLIRACGRTDFQQGDSRKLYKSVTTQIFSLPDDYSLFVGHNYDGIGETTVAEEKQWNPRLSKSEEEFVEIMKNLNLAPPKQIV
ncbi:unnamed protein product, partial [Mesorhabditis belari]|uniref:Metallo-beta-lactamase domain-containing protein n=1 Tax=Mesorhabditis belari TaxID=2138241 RepID=A0AAF3EY34_9BILA